MADEKTPAQEDLVTVGVEPVPAPQDDGGGIPQPAGGAAPEPKDRNTKGLDELVQWLQVPFLLVLLAVCVALRFRGDYSIADVVLAFVGAIVMVVFFVIVRPPNYLFQEVSLPVCKDRFWIALALSCLFPLLFAANLFVAFAEHDDPFMKYQVGFMLIPFALVLLMLTNKWRLLRAAKELRERALNLERLDRETNRTRILLHTSLFCFMLGLMSAVAYIRWADTNDSDEDLEFHRGKAFIGVEFVLLFFFWFNLAWQNMGDTNKCFVCCADAAPRNKTVAIFAGFAYAIVLMADIIWSVSRSNDRTVGLTALELVPLLIVVVYLLWCPPNRKSVVQDISFEFREAYEPTAGGAAPNGEGVCGCWC